MQTNKQFTTDQIMEMIENTDLGFAKDGVNTVSGLLNSYMDDASQALYNIARNPVALAYSIGNINVPVDNSWEEGYNSIISLYIKEKQYRNYLRSIIMKMLVK